jgi:hypothetical protein
MRRGPLVGVIALVLVGALASVASGLIFFTREVIARRLEAKAVEARLNLKALAAAERGYFLEQHAFTSWTELVGFYPDEGARYLYLLSRGGELEAPGGPHLTPGVHHEGVHSDPRHHLDDEALERALPPALAAQLGVVGTCPDCVFTAVAISNLDADATLDLWSVSSSARVIDGVAVPADTPFHHVDDTRR